MASINSLQKEAPPPDGGVQSILDPWRIPSVTLCPFKGGLGSSLWGIWDKKIKANRRKPRLRASGAVYPGVVPLGSFPFPQHSGMWVGSVGIHWERGNGVVTVTIPGFGAAEFPREQLPPLSPCGFWVGSLGSCCIHVGSARPWDKSISHGSGGG